MTSGRIARTWFLLTAVLVAIGLVWQFVLVLKGTNVLVQPTGALPSVLTRTIRFLSYFTIESNILVAVTAAALALHPALDSRVWRALRVAALYGITVTGIVYSTLLRGVVDLHGAAAVTNALLHYVSPVMAVLGWLLFGPRPRLDQDSLLWSMIWPALYVVYSFAHGAASHWYPYPFIDVNTLGYVTVIRNGIGLNLLLVGIGTLIVRLDSGLPPTGSPAASSAA